MRRQFLWVPLVVCVFALSSAVTGSDRAGVRSAMAQNQSNRCASSPIAGCVSYQQKVKQRGLKLILKSRCKDTMSCSVSWDLKCAGKSKLPGSSVFTLMAQSTEIVDASAAACGDKGWEVRNVRWNCTSDD